MAAEKITVQVSSSYDHAVEPRAFVADGERRVIASIERRWRTPGRLHFYVQDERDEMVELIYDQANDEWSLRDFGKVCRI